MVLLHFDSKVELVLEGNIIHLPSIIPPVAVAGAAEAKYTVNAPKTVSLWCWLGGTSQEASVNPVQAQTGMVESGIAVQENDVDTIKFMVTMDIVTIFGVRPYVIACSFIPIQEFCNYLDPNVVPKKCFAMTSNFDKNAVIMQFTNKTTELKQVRSLQLKPSVLHQTEVMNSMIKQISCNLQERVSTMNVTSELGGTQFIPMNTLSYMPMQDVSTCYAILPDMFNHIVYNPVSLPWIMYDMYQTMHHTRIHPNLLATMTSKELVLMFGCPMLQNRCNCALTSPYSEDLTSDKLGRCTKSTEEIGLTFSQLAIQSQLSAATSTSSSSKCNSVPGWNECVNNLCKVRDSITQVLMQESGSSNAQIPLRKSVALCLDDCENGAQGFVLQHKALENIYNQCKGEVHLLTQQMLGMSKEYPHLFENVPDKMHQIMAPILLKLCKLVADKRWNTSLTVVTARNRAMDSTLTSGSSSSSELAGHGVCMAQLIGDDGTMEYIPMEATTSMKMQPSKFTLQRKHDIVCKMADASYQEMDIGMFCTVFAQNLYANASISPFHVIQTNLCENNQMQGDCSKSPFYVGAFYTGFKLQPESLGCMPCTKSAKTAAGLGVAFGAPVISLSAENTFAIPIDTDAKLQIKQIQQQQTTEIWTPFMTKQQLNLVMTHWAKVEKHDISGYMQTRWALQNHVTTLISCAFDDAANKAQALVIYQRLANEFNRLQETNPSQDDGHRLYASADYYSVYLNIVLKLPPDGKRMASGSMSSIKQAVTNIALQKLVQCPYQRSKMQARMDLPSVRPFYKCSEGQGIVHAFNHVLF